MHIFCIYFSVSNTKWALHHKKKLDQAAEKGLIVTVVVQLQV